MLHFGMFTKNDAGAIVEGWGYLFKFVICKKSVFPYPEAK